MREPADRSAPHPAAAVPSVADRDLVLTVRSVTGQWGPLQFSGPGQLRLTSDAMVLDAPRGASLRAKFAAITGAAWRTGALVVHGVDGRVVMETEAGLETAWVALVSRACPLPEFTRGYRRLGSRRGGTPETQARFLGPLLQARRQLEEEADLDRRVAVLEAKALRARLRRPSSRLLRMRSPTAHRIAVP